MPRACEHSFYKVELVLDDEPRSMRSANLETPEEVQSFVGSSLKGNCVLCVARMKDGWDYGNFLAFVNDSGLAYVRLLEHRGFFAQRSPEVRMPGHVIFKDEEGTSFAVSENQTIPASTAIQAFHYWLPSQQASPAVIWGEE